MSQFLAVAVILVGVLGLANLVLVYGVIRRLRALESRIASAGTPDATGPMVPQPGRRIDTFRAVTVDGQTLGVDDLTGSQTLVAFLSAGCGSCDQVLAELGAVCDGTPTLVFVHREQGDAAAEVERITNAAQAVGRVAVVGYDEVSGAFGVTAFPTVLRVGDGVIQAAGHALHDLPVPASAG